MPLWINLVLSQTAAVSLLSLCCLSGDSTGSLQDSTGPSRGECGSGQPETPVLFLGSWEGSAPSALSSVNTPVPLLRAARGLRWHRAGAVLLAEGCGAPGGPVPQLGRWGL